MAKSVYFGFEQQATVSNLWGFIEIPANNVSLLLPISGVYEVEVGKTYRVKLEIEEVESDEN